MPNVDLRWFLRPVPTRRFEEGADPGFLGPGFLRQFLIFCKQKPRNLEVLTRGEDCPKCGSDVVSETIAHQGPPGVFKRGWIQDSLGQDFSDSS